jgi:hypothetical protein
VPRHGDALAVQATTDGRNRALDVVEGVEHGDEVTFARAPKLRSAWVVLGEAEHRESRCVGWMTTKPLEAQ